jgi:hypothetical protein
MERPGGKFLEVGGAERLAGEGFTAPVRHTCPPNPTKFPTKFPSCTLRRHSTWRMLDPNSTPSAPAEKRATRAADSLQFLRYTSPLWRGRAILNRTIAPQAYAFVKCSHARRAATQNHAIGALRGQLMHNLNYSFQKEMPADKRPSSLRSLASLITPALITRSRRAKTKLPH